MGLSRRSAGKSLSGIGNMKSPLLIDSNSNGKTHLHDEDCTPKRKSDFSDNTKHKYSKKLNCTDSDSSHNVVHDEKEEDFHGFQTPKRDSNIHVDESARLKRLELLRKYNLPKNFLDNRDVQHEDVTISSANYENDDIDNLIMQVTARLDKKQKIIRELQVTGLNTLQHDLTELVDLTAKWRAGCQEALNELQSTYNKRGQVFSMSLLLNGFGIPYDLVKFSEEKAGFY